MKGNGRGLNPDGDLELGAYQADAYLSHTHAATVTDTDAANIRFVNVGTAGGIGNSTTGAPTYTTAAPSAGFTVVNAASGGNETRGKSSIINGFIRIN